MPGGFSVVGLDQRFTLGANFRVIAVGLLGAEGIGAGLGIGVAAERAVECNGLELGERFAAASGFEVLLDDLVGVLRARRNCAS